MLRGNLATRVLPHGPRVGEQAEVERAETGGFVNFSSRDVVDITRSGAFRAEVDRPFLHSIPPEYPLVTAEHC